MPWADAGVFVVTHVDYLHLHNWLTFSKASVFHKSLLC